VFQIIVDLDDERDYRLDECTLEKDKHMPQGLYQNTMLVTVEHGSILKPTMMVFPRGELASLMGVKLLSSWDIQAFDDERLATE